MKKNQFARGDIVSIDTDNRDWGRVTGKARILDIPSKGNRRYLVNAQMVRADILVYPQDIRLIRRGTQKEKSQYYSGWDE